MRRTNTLRTLFSFLLIMLLVMTASLAALSPVYAAKKAKISKTKATLYVKETLKLKVTGAAKKVTWSSSNKKVAKVSSKGVVTAVKKGSAKITAKTGKQKLTCKVTVKNPKISDTELYVDLTGTKQLKVSHAVGTVKWSSSDKSVATVSSNGLVTGVKCGEAVVTAVASGVKLRCHIEVISDIGTYLCSWNVNKDLSPAGGAKLTEEQAAEVRNALNRLVDRTYVTDISRKETQESRTAAPSYIALGILEPDGSEFYKHAGPEGAGYYPVTADFDTAVQVLKKYYKYEEAEGKTTFTDFPEITYIYNSEGPVHQSIAQHFAAQLGSVGIKVDLKGYQWNEYNEELKDGNFTVARYGWVIDSYDASEFLGVFFTDSEDNASKLGQGAHASAEYSVDLSAVAGGKYASLSGNWQNTYEKLALYFKEETDPEIRSQLLHKAEDLLMSTGCICPLFFYR